MREKEEPRPRPGALARAKLIEGGDDGLAGPGGRDDEVAKAPVQRALGGEAVEDLELKRKRLKREERELGNWWEMGNGI